MALLTKTGMTGVLKKIMESGELTEEMEESIERLKNDFEEREGILGKYGQPYDEEAEEYDYVYKTEPDETEDWQKKYSDMKAKYVDRFFGGKEVKEDFEEIIDETVDDVKQDGEILTFDELLEKGE